MKKQLLLALTVTIFLNFYSSAQNYPFPQHAEYYNHIKPSQYTQDQLDDHVKTFYEGWKNKHLINGCEDDQYYVYVDEGNMLTVSEAIGYGMLIVPLMAGYDLDARTYFDGLFRYYKAHPSYIMPHLMAWKQITNCINAGGSDSASDGDIDIAFGLLLAHAQWGSQGEINYFQEALLIINDIMGADASEGDIHQEFNSVKLGDWVQTSSYQYGTRTSDFILDHFRAFACAVNDSTWYDVVDECYDLVEEMQTNYSPETGLLPDFIDDINTEPRPADPDYLESDLDGNYSYNACRDPWRLATDYLINGDERARDAVVKINQWLLESTGGSVNHVYAGYYLNGTPAVGWTDIAFTAPFTVGAMLDTTNQEWLDDLYARVLLSNAASGGYYDNTLKMLALLTISGNYWVPPCEILNGIGKTHLKPSTGFDIFPTFTAGYVTVAINEEFAHQNLVMRVFNGSGIQVLVKPLADETSVALNVSGYPAGVYLVTLSTESGQSLGTRKLIRQ